MKKFFDINKFPTNEGIVVLPISMSRIENSQNAKHSFDYCNHLISKIQYTEGIGVVLLYGDYLYFNQNKPAHFLKEKFESSMVSHKNGFLNLLRKDRKWTPKAFSFITFGQILIDNSEIYPGAFTSVFNLYKKDRDFKKFVDMDCTDSGREAGKREVQFILEEITVFYLLQKGVLQIGNRFVSDHEKNWVLHAYPGSFLKSEVYLFKKNPLKLSNPKNKYENSFYDLEKNILCHYDQIDL